MQASSAPLAVVAGGEVWRRGGALLLRPRVRGPEVEVEVELLVVALRPHLLVHKRVRRLARTQLWRGRPASRSLKGEWGS